MGIKTSLSVGDKAPDFTAADALGEQVSLSALRKKNEVVLVFLRYAGCPICQLALADLRARHDEFHAAGAEVLAFVQSPRETLEKSGDVSAFPFHIIPDPHGELYDLYGVGSGNLASLAAPKTLSRAIKATLKGHFQGKMEGNTWQLPGDFIVDKKGLLKLARVGKNMGDNLTAEQLLARLRK